MITVTADSSKGKAASCHADFQAGVGWRDCNIVFEIGNSRKGDK